MSLYIFCDDICTYSYFCFICIIIIKNWINKIHFCESTHTHINDRFDFYKYNYLIFYLTDTFYIIVQSMGGARVIVFFFIIRILVSYYELHSQKIIIVEFSIFISDILTFLCRCFFWQTIIRTNGYDTI